MTTVLGIVCLMIALVGFLVGSHLSFHEWGYVKARKRAETKAILRAAKPLTIGGSEWKRKSTARGRRFGERRRNCERNYRRKS